METGNASVLAMDDAPIEQWKKPTIANMIALSVSIAARSGELA